MNRKKTKHIRDIQSTLEVRSENEKPIIEGYFVVFDSETELFKNGFEKIAKGAFDNTLGNDIRALINHDTRLVLGRNKSDTLKLTVDDHGLYGVIDINQNDTDAMNLYERVKRGDVSQCSFGFNILNESVEHRENGSTLWTIEEIDLHEVSVCTFPAYADTGVEARKSEVEAHEKRKLEQWKNNMKERIKC